MRRLEAVSMKRTRQIEHRKETLMGAEGQWYGWESNMLYVESSCNEQVQNTKCLSTT